MSHNTLKHYSYTPARLARQQNDAAQNLARAPKRMIITRFQVGGDADFSACYYIAIALSTDQIKTTVFHTIRKDNNYSNEPLQPCIRGTSLSNLIGGAPPLTSRKEEVRKHLFWSSVYTSIIQNVWYISHTKGDGMPPTAKRYSCNVHCCKHT